MVATIDCKSIQTREAFYHALVSQLHLPGFHGENVDALCDCLLAMPKQTTLVLMNAEYLLRNLKNYGRAVMYEMSMAERKNPRLFCIRTWN
ncbi:MAG: barstar family protein [Oscillospiraceae bacterium]|nr:barstar family protein [Oscillospiraceae bacterium]